MTRKFVQIVVSLVAVAAPQMNAGTPEQTFRVQQEWKIGGDGGWDRLTVDDAHHRLYIARSNRVTVVDTATGKIAGEITGFKSVHSVSLDNAGKTGFILDESGAGVRVFDRSNLETVTSIPTGQTPSTAVVDPATGSLFLFSGRGRSASIVDPASKQRLQNIALQGKPISAAADGKGFVFAALEDSHRIVRIDTRARQLSGDWQVPACSELTGLAVDSANGRLFSICDYGRVVMVDTSAGKVLATAAVPSGTRALTYDPKQDLIFAANGGGTLSVLHENASGLSVRQAIKIQTGAISLAFDPGCGRIYLPAAQFGLRIGLVSEELRFRPTPVPGSFVILVVGT